MEIATVYEFDENDGFYAISCDPIQYIGHILCYTFHLKRMAFEKKSL